MKDKIIAVGNLELLLKCARKHKTRERQRNENRDATKCKTSSHLERKCYNCKKATNSNPLKKEGNTFVEVISAEKPHDQPHSTKFVLFIK